MGRNSKKDSPAKDAPTAKVVDAKADEKPNEEPNVEAVKAAEPKAKAVNVAPKAKLVKVRALEDHSTTIFKTPYNFSKGKEYEVSNDVAGILQKSQVIAKI